MARQHVLIRGDSERAEVGQTRFTMASVPTLPELPSLADTPCWFCGMPIRVNEEYYIALVWHGRAFLPNSVIVHASHADAAQPAKERDTDSEL